MQNWSVQGVWEYHVSLLWWDSGNGSYCPYRSQRQKWCRTPVAGMVHAFTLLLILLFLMPYASLIPMTCLASILMIVGYNMSGWRTVGRMIKRAPKSDVAVLLVTFVLTVSLT